MPIKVMSLLLVLPLALSFSTFEEIVYGAQILSQRGAINNSNREVPKKHIQAVLDSFFISINSFLKPGADNSTLQACNNSLSQLIEADINKFYSLFSYNGKGYSDIGHEEDCLYFSFNYTKVLYEIKQGSISEENEVIQFLNQNKFYTGLCLTDKCLRVAEDMTSQRLPNSLFAYLDAHYRLQSFSFLHPPPRLSSSSFVWFSVLIYVIIAYFSFKVLLTLVRIAFFSSNNGNNSKLQEGMLELEEEDEPINLQDKLEDDIDVDNKKNRRFTAEKRKSKPEFIFSKNAAILAKAPRLNQLPRPPAPSFMSRFVKFFDFFHNFHNLTLVNSVYYNDKQISMFSFIRVILMLFITYNHNFFTTTKMPGKDFLHADFYKSFLFFCIKLSVHSLPLWIALDAATFMFRFMSSIKSEIMKKRSNSISIVFILKWWLYSLPKVAVFFFIFFFFHVFMDYYKVFFNTGTMFEYYLQNFQDRQCTQRPWELLIPFFIPYKDNERGFVYCYRFVYVFLNEFYCFLFFTVYFYLLMKIKTRLVDYIFLVLAVLNMLLTYLSIPYSRASYDIGNVLGQDLTEKYSHLSFNFYFMGVLIGMSYFYYYDAVSKDSLSQNYFYYPFCYCYFSMKRLDTLKIFWKKALLWLCLLLLFLDSMSYMFIRVARATPQNTLCFKMDSFINFYEQYDKLLFALCFSFIIVLLLLFPKETMVKHLIASNIFFPFSRVGTAFLCLSNTIIYIAYCVFLIQLKLSYPNLFFITIGLFLIISFLSFLVHLMFEFPFRVLFKTFIRWLNDKDPSSIDDLKMLDEINQSMQLMEE